MEVVLYASVMECCSANKDFTSHIYQGIKDQHDDEIPSSLILMYGEAIHGENVRVKKRIRDRVYKIGQLAK